jgi:hypothetical protein
MQSLRKVIADLPPAKRNLLLQSLLHQGRPLAPEQERPSREDLEAYPLSFGQQRLWFLQRLEPGSAAYNYPVVIRLDGPLQVEALTGSLSEILRAPVSPI